MYAIIPQPEEKLTDISNLLKNNNVKFEYPDNKVVKKTGYHVLFIIPITAISVVESLGFDLIKF